MTNDLLLYLLTAACSVIVAIGTYWARSVDSRITNMEGELEREKLLTNGRLARLEALLESVKSQLDRIEREIHHDRR